uniref:TGB protein 1 n=1 Tax=Opuntia virus X TaxID=253702 RepID=A0A173G3F4_9VIRU|nr:triple gene block gene protein 1 [Opuntia virus X]ATU47237.1 TGB protein 1 [Opuntia virus X]
MENLVAMLTANDYTRTDRAFSKPLIVHAVAGAGKTSLIRRFMKENAQVSAQTHGTPDPPNLTRKMITKVTAPKSNHFNILDEYCAFPLKGSWDACFADPLQHPDFAQEPHFIKETTHRFGPETCELIKSLGIPICPLGPSQVLTIKGLFEGEIFGKVICLDSDIAALACRHRIPISQPKQTIGLEFPTVTVLSSLPLSQVEDVTGAYISLTRHTKELHVRAPPETHSTA